MRTRVVALGVCALALALALAGCGGAGEGAETPAATDGGASAAQSAVITLPDGWAMEDVLTAEEIGAITGKPMVFFPEAASAAQDGKPKGSFTNEGAPNSKLYIAVDVAGGEEEFEKSKQFTDQATITEVPGLGDKAYSCTFSGGTIGVVVLRGDAVIRVDWPPSAYGDDAAGTGGAVAELLMSKMFE